MAFPVRTVSQPASLTGQSNGQLAASILRETPGLAGGPGVLLVAPAARAWRALTAAASAAGHTLKISHPNSAYRPYADQERIFRERYVTWNTGNESRYWNGQTWWRRDGVAAAAVPGTSNHGWALAVDVGEERDGDSGAESIDSGTVAWLVANEERFGFSHELQTEPWHIRYFTGDDIPQAVLDYERSEPAPPQQEEDPFMALSDAEQQEILAAVRQTAWPPGTPKEAQHRLWDLALWTLAETKANRDPAAFAAAIAAHLDGITVDQVTEAVKVALREGAG